MPETKEYTIYKFEELSDRAKETARDWWRQAENEDFDTEFLYDDFEHMGKLLGIEFKQRASRMMDGGTHYAPTIYWSGFSSQGDGACFEGTYSYRKGAAKAIRKESGDSEKTLIDIAERLQALQKRNFYGVTADMAHSGHYYHSGCMRVTVEHDSGRDVADADDFIECMRDFADWIYSRLEAEYNSRMEDEYVDDAITANEYTFDINGRRKD